MTKRRNRSSGVSLARALSKLGYCSRSRAETLISAGRVAVDEQICRQPARRVQLEQANISVDGRPLSAARKVYIMLNKPRGLVTSTADEQGRDTVYQCLDDPALPWLFPVGRLDKASEGLLLFSNDTHWAHRITDPAGHVDKIYHVQINRLADQQLLDQLLQGVLDGDELFQTKAVAILRSGLRNSWLEITLDQGKNRHIRRLFSVLDIKVLRLLRVAIGPLQLGDLAKGQWRYLTAVEQRYFQR